MQCFVVDCSHTSVKDGKSFSYHGFPKKDELRAEWLKRIGRDPNYFIVHERVCSDHFSDDNFVTEGNRTKLIESALPTSNLPKRNCAEALEQAFLMQVEPDFKSGPDLAIRGALADKENSCLPSSSKGETRQKPTLTYSEELYKTLLEQHDLDKGDPLAVFPDDELRTLDKGDPLAIFPDDQQDAFQAKSDTDLCPGLKVEPEEDLLLEEHPLPKEVETQIELIKIEIVNDDNEELFNAEGISSSQLADDRPEVFKQGSATTHKKRPLTKRPTQTKVVLHNTESSQDLSDLIPHIIAPPLSYRDLSAMKLDFNYNLNFNDSSNDQRLTSLTGMSSEILDVCEKCMENTLYEKGISDGRNIRLKIALVLIKLKTHLPCNILAVMLGLNEDVCNKIFYSMLDILFASLKPAICWFTIRELMDGTARELRRGSYGVRVVLHPFNFKVIKCQKDQCDVSQCEQYKQHQFVTVIVGLSPKKRLISYVTKAYNTKIPITFMLGREHFFTDLCYQGDIVVVTKPAGSQLLLKECQKRGIELKRLHEMIQVVQDYTNNTVRSLEEFEILKRKDVHSHMLPLIGKAVGVICGVLNLRCEAENTEECHRMSTGK